jgi:hypothetical protein
VLVVRENQRILIECIHNENLRYHESEALVGFAKTVCSMLQL